MYWLICLVHSGMRNISHEECQDSRCPSRDAKREPPEHKPGASPLHHPAPWACVECAGKKTLAFKACSFSKSCDAAPSNWCLSDLLQWCTHLLSWKWLSLKPLACECLMKFAPISLSQGWSKKGHMNLKVPTETLAEFSTARTMYRLSYPGIQTRAVWGETSGQKTLPLRSFYAYHANNAFFFNFFTVRGFVTWNVFRMFPVYTHADRAILVVVWLYE